MNDDKKNIILTWWDKLKARFPSARWVYTTTSFYSALKYQPCPECRKGSRCVEKQETAVIYRCCNHGKFSIARGG